MDPTEEAKRRRQKYGEAKALEEQRKYGLAQLAVDSETGKEINPHLPQILTSVPWYYGTGTTTLVHQSKSGQGAESNKATASSSNSNKSSGSLLCTKCGATDHIARDCLDSHKIAVGQSAATKPRQQQEQEENTASSPTEAETSGLRAPPPSPADPPITVGPLLGHQREGVTAVKEKARRRKRQFDDADDALLGMIAEEQQQLQPAAGQGNNSSSEEKSAAPSVPPNSAVTSSSGSASSSINRKTVDELSTVATTTSNPHRVQHAASALPKYLISLKDDDAFFDPKSRTMNVAPTPTGNVVSSFQGDQARAQTKSALETLNTMAEQAGITGGRKTR